MANEQRCPAYCCKGCQHYKGESSEFTMIVCWMNDNVFKKKSELRLISPKQRNNMSRNSELAKIHIAKKILGMDDDTYRMMLENMTGKNSTKDMTINERYKVLAHLKKLGFKPKAKRGQDKSTNWRKPRIAKITALWFVLFEAGEVRDKNITAMEHWCSTITGKNSLNWSTSDDLNKCIEGLKSWCNRMGVKHG